MDIIPHKVQFIQATIYPELHSRGCDLEQMLAAVPGLSSIQQQAYKLFHAGLNVFPLPHGAKAGYPWKPLQYTRLHRTHHFLGIIPLFAGACNIGVMCGATSGNLFVIDCESHEIFMQHIAALQNRRIPVWAVLTARGGHIYLRCREGEVANIRPGILPFAELRGQHGYVLAAESLHPAGSVYTWLLQEGDLPPMVEAARINWLVDRRGLPVELTVVPNRLNRHTRWTQMMVSPFSNLSKTTKEYLAEGHRIPEGSRNNRLFAAACDLAGNDYDQSEIEALLVPLALVSGLPQHEILLTIASACSRSRQPSRPPQRPVDPLLPPAPKSDVWLKALLVATQHDWRGATGGNLRALFLALVERARLGASEYGLFRASLRELAQLGRMALNTVRRLLDRLVAMGMLVKCGQDRLSGASLWRFSDTLLLDGLRLQNLPDATVPEHWRAYAESLFHSDAAERGAIGKSGMFLYRFMTTCRQPMMPAQLAAVTRLSINQVNYALAKLRRYGIIQRTPAGWQVEDHTDLQLGRITLTAGRGAARQRRHIRDRELYAGQLLLTARMRSEGQQLLDALIAQGRALYRTMQPRYASADDPLYRGLFPGKL